MEAKPSSKNELTLSSPLQQSIPVLSIYFSSNHKIHSNTNNDAIQETILPSEQGTLSFQEARICPQEQETKDEIKSQSQESQVTWS